MDFSQQMTIIRDTMWAKSLKRENKVKFISPEKWRAIMWKCLQKFKTKGIFDQNMIDDLQTILKKIPEDKFVEATLNLQPFKPIFSQTARKHKESKAKSSSDQFSEEEETQITRTKLEESPRYKNSSIIQFKHTVTERIADWQQFPSEQPKRKSLLEEMLSLVTEQLTLVREFEAKYHPFRKIMESFLFLLEGKYKMMIDSVDIVDVEQIQEKLIIDLRLYQQFIVKSSEPYLELFKTQNIEEQEIFRVKLIAFINQYIEKHQKVNHTIRKILRSACKKTKVIRTLTQKLPDFATITEFDVPKDYQIDGCYAHAMTTLVSLVQCTSSRNCLKKLKELRFSLGKDIDLFYSSQKQVRKQMQLSSQTQLEIMKFLVAKLKAFVVQIYAQLKYLQVVCGQEDMSYKYDDSSYIYAQLSVAFEALELDYS